MSVRTGRDAVRTAQERPLGAGAGADFGWIAENNAIALDRVPTLNRRAGSDLDDGDFIASALAAEDLTRSFGVYTLPGGVGTGVLTLAKSATQIKLFAPKAESWFARNRVMVPAPFTNAAGVVSVALSLSQGADALWIVGRGTGSTTEFRLEFYNPGLTTIPLGALATLGAPTCPVGAMFPISANFRSDLGRLSIEFSDTVVYQSTSLAAMSGLASIIQVIGNDQTQPLLCDAMYCAGVRTNQ